MHSVPTHNSEPGPFEFKKGGRKIKLEERVSNLKKMLSQNSVKISIGHFVLKII